MIIEYQIKPFWRNIGIFPIAIILSLYCLISSGCDNQKSNIPNAKKINQNTKMQTTDFQAGFTSQKGNYSIPIDYSTEAVIAGIGADQQMWKFIQRHSNHNLWTYILKSNSTSRAGWDKFTRQFGSELAQIQIMWSSPSQHLNLKQDFDNATKFHKSLKAWVDGSEEEIEIDNNKGLSGRFKMNLGDKIMHSTFIIIHTLQKRYQIQYSYTESFSDPDNTLEKIKQIKFHK